MAQIFLSVLVKELGLQGERRDFFLTTQEKKDSAKSGLELKLSISSLDGASTLEIPRVWSVDCLNISSRSIPVPEDVKGWPHLSDIELPEIQGKDVRLLIGCNAPEAFWVLEERRGARGEPIAVRSILGWTLMGPVERISGDSSFNVNFVRLESGRGDRDEALLQQVEKFWKTDFVDALCSSKVAMSVEDQNDQLLHGPDLTNNLFGVLNTFRQESIALVSDIEAMFHHVRVDPRDHDAVRFLWWPDDDVRQQPVVYRMEVHIFGSTSSPSVASSSLRKTAQDNVSDFGHEVIDTVLQNFYVDDCLKSVSSRAVAVHLRVELCRLLSTGGFRLTKWLSNDKDVLETIPKYERAPSVLDLDLFNDNLPLERTLGVQWNVDSDSFTFE